MVELLPGPTGLTNTSMYVCRLEWHADKPVAQLTEADVGKFFEIGASNIPEAFQDWYATSAAAGETFVEKGGCKGLQVRPSCNFTRNKQHVYMATDKPHTFQIHVADRPLMAPSLATHAGWTGSRQGRSCEHAARPRTARKHPCCPHVFAA